MHLVLPSAMKPKTFNTVRSKRLNTQELYHHVTSTYPVDAAHQELASPQRANKQRTSIRTLRSRSGNLKCREGARLILTPRWVQSLTPLVAVMLLVFKPLVGPSSAFGKLPRTFHVGGTVRDYNGVIVAGPRRDFTDLPVAGAEVIFVGANIVKTVSADEKGHYETDLPLSQYRMIAYSGSRFLQVFERPVFWTGSLTNVTLDVRFEPYRNNCDLGIHAGHIPNAEDFKNACGGSDSFAVASGDGDLFELAIRYKNREHIDGGYAYVKGSIPYTGPVFVAYNLFTLRAEYVVYDEKSRTLEAHGNVIVEAADGTVQQSAAVKFRLENGDAKPIP
jgi:hypothetical protein